RMFDHIADDLDLDEEQRAAFDEIADGVREQMRERWDGMRGKVEELREAADSGNYELADQIRRELEDSRGNPGEVMDNAIAQLEPILRPAQVTRLHEMRDDMRRREDSRDFYRRVARDLPDELNMTDEQRDQYDEILDGRREQMRARFDEMRPLFEEMREAREAGNMDRVNELRDQLRANRPDENALQEDFFTQVDTILTDEQRAALADFREWNAPDAAGDAGAATTDSAKKAADVRDVIRAAHRVRLAPDQRDELKEIERDAMRDYRAARRDPAKAASLADRVKAEVLELLDDNQTEDFQNRLDGRGNRPARKARRG
ncbi:MAG: Spy/CpxP family protein refolding chaperone, partial [Phycisphaerales bacterium]|nr:Spy/CpxP family protein refolding chaperone [Phycisphaerales bacterium]